MTRKAKLTLSFAEALERSSEVHAKLRHVLLGNGFSIACRADCFKYENLLDEADLSDLSVVGIDLFKSESSNDFESIIRALRAAARMADFYRTTDPKLAARFRSDADNLREILAKTLARRHPDHVGSIKSAEYEAARVFLANFDHFFTLNYDLLLYWTLLQQIEKVEYDDGFRSDPDDPDAPWVAWNSYNQYRQKIYFIHGGLHLYAEGATLKKLTFKRTGEALLKQIRSQLKLGAFPLIVTEGTSQEKHAAILRHAYLGKCLRSLASCGGSLFIHGHSLDDNDSHVLRAIVEAKYKAIFVSLHGSPESEDNRAMRLRAEALAARRQPGQAPLAVHFYDADSAAVWG